MNPRVRMRLGHPQELSLHLVERMLLHGGQDEEPLVGRRWERTGVIRPVAAARAGLPIHGAVRQIRHQHGLARGPQCHQFRFRQAGHRSSIPGTLRDVLIAWPTHLPPSMSYVG